MLPPANVDVRAAEFQVFSAAATAPPMDPDCHSDHDCTRDSIASEQTLSIRLLTRMPDLLHHRMRRLLMFCLQNWISFRQQMLVPIMQQPEP